MPLFAGRRVTMSRQPFLSAFRSTLARGLVIAAHSVPPAALLVAIFTSAFLLFQIEPMMGKLMLPWFGGAQSVWTTCILFFQLLLLGGYAYAHTLAAGLRLRRQAAVHTALIAVCLVAMTTLAVMWRSPIIPPASWGPLDPQRPALRIIALLSACAGLPYFTLSATAPLLQQWFATKRRDSSPYRLYALSNVGAMLGLVSYPFVAEPALSLHRQAWFWYVLYIVFALSLMASVIPLCSVTPPCIADAQPLPDAASAGPDRAAARYMYFFWIALAACPSLMFLAVTNQLCEDVAAVPFLWVLPLAIYLLSFIVCFGDESWYRRGAFNGALAVAIVLSCAVLYRPYTAVACQIAVYSFLLACSCMVCHGELVRLQPQAARLTGFYLMVSVGGALGGLFGALLAPLLFRGYWELQLSIWGCVALLFIALVRDNHSWIHQRGPVVAVALLGGAMALPELMLLGAGKPAAGLRYNVAAMAALVVASAASLRQRESVRGDRSNGLVAVCAGAALLILGCVLLSGIAARMADNLIAERNFYGAFAVVERDAKDPQWRSYLLRHGRIAHGMQFPQRDKRYRPTAYYGPTSGAGLVMLHHPRRLAGDPLQRTLRVGVVGLGVGTLAAYGQSGDYFRFYEINPAIVKLATAANGYFTYLHDSRARIDIIPGDARLSMEREMAGGGAQRFDLLVIDAFSGDAIPVHLLTREAFELYRAELNGDGVVALHISNGYLDLRPVLARLAQHFGLRGGWVHSRTMDRLTQTSDWVLLAPNNNVLAQPAISAALRPLETKPGVELWTDDYSNLFRILR
jgi:hypothetical protein